MIMKNINFSFVIPHKNTPDLLNRCVKSIPSRRDIEIIIVDDASDEQIVDFSTYPGKEDPNVKILFLTESKGAGAARNEGLKLAVGKWVIFADADDYFNYCINDCLNDYMDSDSDIIFFKANSVDTYNYTNSYRSLQLNRFIDIYKKNPDRATRLLRYRFGEPWAKILRRDIIVDNSISFDEVIVHNDTMFSLLTGFHAKKVSVDDRAIYCCTTRKDSISYSMTKEKHLIRVFVFARVEQFFDKNEIGLGKINKHIISLSYLLFFDWSYFKKALRILNDLGFSKIYIFYKVVLTFPYFIIDLNKGWLRKILYRFL